jgi:hypothetical protein
MPSRSSSRSETFAGAGGMFMLISTLTWKISSPGALRMNVPLPTAASSSPRRRASA